MAEKIEVIEGLILSFEDVLDDPLKNSREKFEQRIERLEELFGAIPENEELFAELRLHIGTAPDDPNKDDEEEFERWFERLEELLGAIFENEIRALSRLGISQMTAPQTLNLGRLYITLWFRRQGELL